LALPSGDVLQLHVLRGRGIQRNAEVAEHVHQALRGERRLGGLVAGAVEPDHEAVADQRIVTHALERNQVLEALRLRGLRECGSECGNTGQRN